MTPSHPPQPRGWLIALDGDVLPPVCAVSDRPLTIGRAPGCAVVVPLRTVSRRHATITHEGARLLIDDAASANGTFVNGRRIAGPHPLSDEDLISLGAGGPLIQFLARPAPD